jgi:hypothetical protein
MDGGGRDRGVIDQNTALWGIIIILVAFNLWQSFVAWSASRSRSSLLKIEQVTLEGGRPAVTLQMQGYPNGTATLSPDEAKRIGEILLTAARGAESSKSE